MHPDDVSRLLNRAHEQSQNRALSNLTSNTVSAMMANSQSSQGTAIDDRLNRIEALMQNMGQQNRFPRHGRGYHQRPFGNNGFRKRPGFLGAYEAAKRPSTGPPKCYNCDRIGHLARECRAPKRTYPVTKTAVGDQGKAERA
jgi:hypothetical protein